MFLFTINALNDVIVDFKQQKMTLAGPSGRAV